MSCRSTVLPGATQTTVVEHLFDTARRQPVRKQRSWSTMAAALLGATLGTSVLTACGASAPSATTTSGRGPAPSFDCRFDLTTQTFAGAYGTASAMGWLGNHQAVITCLGGTFHVQNGIDRNFGFGIYTGGPTTWSDADGYLPAQITRFDRGGAHIAITEFADAVVVEGHRFVAAYSRVAVTNTTDRRIVADPEPSTGMVVLRAAPDVVPAHTTADHDYVVAVDRFGDSYRWPSASALSSAGSFDQHYAHMRAFWNHELAAIAQIDVPDRTLADAYRSGFIYTQIARSGDHLDTGVNGYEAEFSHDVVGILANLFTQGDFSDAHALLLEARSVVGSQDQYQDGIWTYAWPWAIYLLKTGDISFVKKNFTARGPLGAAEPSIEDTAHDIAADRTGPGGTIGMTDDIDTNGYWTVDDYEALMGLAAYRYLARRVGDTAEARWAADQYNSLLDATNTTLDATIQRYGLDYLPCSMLEPNTANRCNNPEDANWAAPMQFGKWAWDGQLFDAPVTGPGVDLIDATYTYGFGRLDGLLPANTFGGFPSDYYSTAYNAGYGSWGLASQDHRDQGILAYQFMIGNTQSGPYSWWESASAPSTSSPWVGIHPAGGQGSSPHAWGIAEAKKVLLDSLVAERSDGTVIVGRGIPPQWLGNRQTIAVTGFPTTDGERLDVRISTVGQSVSLRLGGGRFAAPTLFELPSFVNNIAGVSSGTLHEATGTVTLAPGDESVTVQLRQPPTT
jgi:hypothetical protein